MSQVTRNQGRLPFYPKVRNFRNGDNWYGNCLGKVPENPEIVEFPKSEPFNRKSGNSGMKVKWNGNFQEKFFRKFGYTSRSCSALASCFAHDYNELDVSRKNDGEANFRFVNGRLTVFTIP